jgi:hypothetical protein
MGIGARLDRGSVALFPETSGRGGHTALSRQPLDSEQLAWKANEKATASTSMSATTDWCHALVRGV